MSLTPHKSRREFLRQLTSTTFIPALARAVRAQNPPVSLPEAPFSRGFDFSRLNSWITPNSDFFVRSHFGVPAVELAGWTISVTGAVDREQKFAIDELFRMPRQDSVVTLECAGNLVGWGGVSNARWTGISLSRVIEAAGVHSGATEVVLVGADGGNEREAGGIHLDAYARSIPISKAMDSNTLLAYRMNGEPLPDVHGGPLRAIVPGWYGMDSVKWLRQIVVTREPFRGWYQLNRYYEERRASGRVERRSLGPVRVKSQIAQPLRDQVITGPVTIAGAAWCGDAEIKRVMLSFDGGKSWTETRLGGDRERYAWKLWSYEWTPAKEGRCEIIARAIDSLDREQPLVRDPSILTPYANNWSDRRTVEVR
jgi:DMSO/TMAO reductase YedYZ molybdopterin-dependent catalytic subunit